MRKEIALAFIANEYNDASSKFPKFNSAHEGWAVLKEEMDELWESEKLINALEETKKRIK